MRVKIKKLEKGEWRMSLLRGKGGISSAVAIREGSFLHCIKVFSFRNIYRALTW